MRKFIFPLLLAFTAKAQITLDNAYIISASVPSCFTVVKLSNSGYKYVDPDIFQNIQGGTVTLYNLNNTIFKTMTYTVPYFASGNSPAIFHISETLFDNNPSNVEFLMWYVDVSYVPHITIFDENGTILFVKDSVGPAGYNDNGINDPIRYTTNGVKMLLYKWNNPNNIAYVYSLPGNLVCNDCTNGQVSSMMKTNGQEGSSTPFPNPSQSDLKIKYTLPAGTKRAKISFYDMQGKEIKSFDIDDHTDFITMSKEELGVKSGMYFYKIYSSDKIISTEKVIFE